MTSPPDPVPSLLVVAAFSRHDAALAWARPALQAAYGPIALASPEYRFHHTGYYASTMGENLRKQFLAFQKLVPTDSLADVKRHAIGLERELAAQRAYPEVRPLNLDPGLLQLGKFLLATTKDQSHRIYLRDGIYAEVTLRFHAGAYEPWPWTYADYREPALREFLKSVRDFYRVQLACTSTISPEYPP
jgi:hypothetical protein